MLIIISNGKNYKLLILLVISLNMNILRALIIFLFGMFPLCFYKKMI